MPRVVLSHSDSAIVRDVRDVVAQQSVAARELLELAIRGMPKPPPNVPIQSVPSGSA